LQPDDNPVRYDADGSVLGQGHGKVGHLAFLLVDELAAWRSAARTAWETPRAVGTG
jgi:hypothetical protein